MTDSRYLEFIMTLQAEALESLMISEHYRLRSFTSSWPVLDDIVSKHDLAKSGFFYTGKYFIKFVSKFINLFTDFVYTVVYIFYLGIRDRVRCTFCGGFLNNFEKGDNVHQLHKDFFSYCKMVLSKYLLNKYL
jgi:hypothetical protein